MEDVAGLTTEALGCALRELARAFAGQRVYALIYYVGEGFQGVGLAVGTRESLRKTVQRARRRRRATLREFPDLAATEETPDEYYEVAACEWNDLGVAQHCFDELNRALMREGIRRTAAWRREVEEALLGSMQVTRSEGLMTGPPFEEHLLLGIQHPEPSDLKLVERASKALNDPAWHKKVLAYCARERRHL